MREARTSSSTDTAQDLVAAKLSAQALAELRDLAAPKTYIRGHVLAAQEDEPNDVVFVVDGVCKLVWRAADGRQMILGLRPSGWAIGSAYGLLGTSQPYAVEAIERCIVLRVSVRAFVERLQRRPLLACAMIGLHALELEQAQTIQRLSSCNLPADVRVTMLLSWLRDLRISVRGAHDSQHVVGALSQREMANVLAMAPETLTRVLNRMQRAALIVKKNGWITILHDWLAS